MGKPYVEIQKWGETFVSDTCLPFVEGVKHPFGSFAVSLRRQHRRFDLLIFDADGRLVCSFPAEDDGLYSISPEGFRYAPFESDE